MKEHEKDDFVDFSKMTQGQIIMHHFRQFDQNKDGRVDGLEIFKKIQRENGKRSILLWNNKLGWFSLKYIYDNA